ncbi:unnamed protein product, partial [Effrenium voratum]
KLGEQHPQYEMRRSSVRQACHGVHFVVLCICLTNRCADSCNPEQCKSLVTNLKDCVDTAYFGGGDNLIALCARDDGTELAVRLSVVEDIRPKSEYDSFRTMYLFSKDLARSLCGHDWIQSLIVPKLRKAMQQTSVRRILRTSEYHGEIRWRDEFLWRKMVFAPAPSLHECLACVQICSRVPVLNQNHQRVANLSRSVQIGISIMKGVDGSFKSVYEKLTVQAISTILVGYHLDLATMADSNHFHDAHEGNVLLSLSGVDFPEIRWHDFGGSYKPAGGLVTPALTADFVGKIERFSDTGINRIRMTHQDFASRLNETRKKCTLVGQEMVLVPLCLRQRAFSLVETMLNADVMDTSAQRKLLEKISLGMPELSQKELWRQFFAGSAASQPPPAVWVCQLGSPDGKDFEIVGNAFKITASVSDVDDLKEAIEKKAKLSVAAFKIDIYRQKEGGWVREDEEAAVNRGKSKADCYGFMLPAGAAGAA